MLLSMPSLSVSSCPGSCGGRNKFDKTSIEKQEVEGAEALKQSGEEWWWKAFQGARRNMHKAGDLDPIGGSRLQPQHTSGGEPIAVRHDPCIMHQRIQSTAFHQFKLRTYAQGHIVQCRRQSLLDTSAPHPGVASGPTTITYFQEVTGLGGI
jgi:hypothetical protein